MFWCENDCKLFHCYNMTTLLFLKTWQMTESTLDGFLQKLPEISDFLNFLKSIRHFVNVTFLYIFYAKSTNPNDLRGTSYVLLNFGSTLYKIQLFLSMEIQVQELNQEFSKTYSKVCQLMNHFLRDKGNVYLDSEWVPSGLLCWWTLIVQEVALSLVFYPFFTE